MGRALLVDARQISAITGEAEEVRGRNLAVERMAILFGTNSEDIRAALKQNATRVLSFVDLAGNDGKPDRIK
jgi:hypothetical protein